MKKIIIITTALIILSVVSVFLGIRIYLCYKVYDSVSNILENTTDFSVKELKPDNSFKGSRINLGYCTFEAPGKIGKIAVAKTGFAVFVEGNNYTLRLIRPVPNNPDVFDKYLIKNGQVVLSNPAETVAILENIQAKPDGEEILANIFNDYRWQLNAWKTKPKSFFELLLSSSSNIVYYSIKTLQKGNMYSGHGIKLLNTNSIKAIIYSGSSDPLAHKNVSMVTIWPNNGKMLQTMVINAKPEKRRLQIITKILSTFKYSITSLPPDKEVREMNIKSVDQLNNSKQ